MTFFAPLAFSVLGLIIGAGLAAASFVTGMPNGWVGAAGLILWALAMRRRWARQETDGQDPGAPERILWLRLAGCVVILGHVVAAIVLVGDGLRLGSGNSLAIDSWTMIAGHQIAAFLFRHHRRQVDERHALIAAGGFRVGHVSLVLLEIVLLPWLVAAPPDLRASLSHFTLANVQVVFLLLSYAAMLLTQLFAYGRDARDMRDAFADD